MLWDAEGHLRYDLLHEEPDCLRYRADLTESNRYQGDVERFFPWGQERPYYQLKADSEGRHRLVAMKFKLDEQEPMIRVFSDRLEVVQSLSHQTRLAARRSWDAQHPVFVMPFILGRHPRNLPLGYFLVTSDPMATDGPWLLRRDASSHNLERPLAKVESRAEPRAEPRALPDPRMEPRSIAGLMDGVLFDSRLEALHAALFQALKLPYVPHPGEFNIAGLSPLTSGQRTYRPDGLLTLTVLAPPARRVLLEIKPRYPLAIEQARMYALCHRFSYPVLCSYWSPATEEAPSLLLYLPGAPGDDPVLLQGLVFSPEGPNVVAAPADPNRRVPPDLAAHLVDSRAYVEKHWRPA